MKKLMYIIFFVAGLSLSAEAQQWNAWTFQYDFKINNDGLAHYKFDCLEISINEPFESTKFQGGDFLYNDSTETYSLKLSYGCISCGYGGTRFPPTVFFKVYLFDAFHNQYISILIPITSDEIQVEDRDTFDLGTICFNDFIFFNSNYERFEGLRIKKDGTVNKYKKGEYDFPSTNKLLQIK